MHKLQRNAKNMKNQKRFKRLKKVKKAANNVQKLLKTHKTSKKVLRRPTDRPTNEPTDKMTYRVACTRLKYFILSFDMPHSDVTRVNSSTLPLSFYIAGIATITSSIVWYKDLPSS